MSKKQRKLEAEKYSLDTALEKLALQGATPFVSKKIPLRLKRNEHIYFLASELSEDSPISLAFSNQRIFFTSSFSTTGADKSGMLSILSFPFTASTQKTFAMTENTLLQCIAPSQEKLRIKSGLTTKSISTVIAVDIPEPNKDYSAWLMKIHFDKGKNLRFFFDNSHDVHKFYALLTEMVDRLNDPIDNAAFSPKRERIPDEVKVSVWRRDEGACVRCGSRERLEYDHIIPVSKGGSNTSRNIELLCESCNRKKSNKIM